MKRISANEFNSRKDKTSFVDKKWNNKDSTTLAANNAIVVQLAEIQRMTVSFEVVTKLLLVDGDILRVMEVPKQLIIAMSVTYARCFGTGRFTRNAREVMSDIQYEYHRELINHRNQYAAHNVNSHREASVRLSISNTKEEFLISPVYSEILGGKLDIKKLKSHCHEVAKSLLSENRNLEVRIERELSERGLEYFRGLPDVQ